MKQQRTQPMNLLVNDALGPMILAGYATKWNIYAGLTGHNAPPSGCKPTTVTHNCSAKTGHCWSMLIPHDNLTAPPISQIPSRRSATTANHDNSPPVFMSKPPWLPNLAKK